METNVQPPAMPVQSLPPQKCGMATASLVCGILSMVCCCIFTGIPAIILGHKAKTKIKNSQNTLTGEGMALAGLILGYVNLGLSIILIPIYLAIAIPAFAQARGAAMKQHCINNLRQIDSAKEEWALENNKTAGTAVQMSDIYNPADPNKSCLKTSPVCTAGGTYSINPMGVNPTCSFGKEHTL